jgi:serine/threonine protein kinase
MDEKVLRNTYEIIQMVGKGGMARVYKARHLVMNKLVAVKEINQHLLDVHPDMRKRFLNEAKVSLDLRHDNIVAVYDLFEENGGLYIVMDYIEGSSIKDILDEGERMNLDEIAHVLDGIASALDYIHRKNLVHRDIKSSNIMIRARDRRVFLMDFGIAKDLSSEKITQAGDQVGTPEYMSPEQAQGFKQDRYSDQYSLGIVVFEMLTGKVPFSADTPAVTLLKQISEPVPNPRDTRPNLSLEIERVVMRALAKNPKDRFPSAGAFSDAFMIAVEMCKDKFEEKSKKEVSIPKSPARDIPQKHIVKQRREDVTMLAPAPQQAPVAQPVHQDSRRTKVVVIVLVFIIVFMTGGMGYLIYLNANKSSPGSFREYPVPNGQEPEINPSTQTIVPQEEPMPVPGETPYPGLQDGQLIEGNSGVTADLTDNTEGTGVTTQETPVEKQQENIPAVKPEEKKPEPLDDKSKKMEEEKNKAKEEEKLQQAVNNDNLDTLNRLKKSQNPAENALYDKYQQAQREFDNNQFDSAITVLDKHIIPVMPDLPDSYSLKAKSYINKARGLKSSNGSYYKDEEIKGFLVLARDNVNIFRKKIEGKSGQYSAQINFCNQESARIDSDINMINAKTTVRCGNKELQSSSYNYVTTYYCNRVNTNPSDVDAYLNLAKLSKQKKFNTEAVDLYFTAFDKTSNESYISSGSWDLWSCFDSNIKYYKDKNLYDGYVSKFAQLENRFPNNSTIKYIRGTLFFRENNKTEAMKKLEESLYLYYQDDARDFLVKEIYKDDPQMAQRAINLFTRIITKPETQPKAEYFYYRGHYYDIAGNFTAASADMLKSIELNPNYSQAITWCNKNNVDYSSAISGNKKGGSPRK